MSDAKTNQASAFDLMGQAMRSKVAAAQQSMATPHEKYANIASEHFALISRGQEHKIVFVSRSSLGSKSVPFCHEVMDPRFAHYAYPLMASQLKLDLGTLKDFMVRNKSRMDFYRLMTSGKSAAELDDLTCVRAIAWAEGKSLAVSDANAKQALSWVARVEQPSFDLRLTPEERVILSDRKSASV